MCYLVYKHKKRHNGHAIWISNGVIWILGFKDKTLCFSVTAEDPTEITVYHLKHLIFLMS